MPDETGQPVTQTSPDDKIFAHMDAADKLDTPATSQQSSNSVPVGGKPNAPADRQTTGEASTKPDASQAKNAGDPAPLSEADFAKAARDALGLKAPPPETADHWKKQYEASSKEGRILAAQQGALKNALLKMGLDVVHGKDGVGFKANKEYVAKSAKEISDQLLKGLTDDDRSLAMDNPNAFAALLASRLLEGRSPEPTVSRVEIDDAIAEKVRTTIAESKEGDQPELPEFKALWPFMDALLAETSDEGKAFKEFMLSSEANYAFGLRLLHGRVFQRLSPLLQRQAEAQRKLKEKETNARGDVSLASETTQGAGAGKKAATEAEEIATAGAVF